MYRKTFERVELCLNESSNTIQLPKGNTLDQDVSKDVIRDSLTRSCLHDGLSELIIYSVSIRISEAFSRRKREAD